MRRVTHSEAISRTSETFVDLDSLVGGGKADASNTDNDGEYNSSRASVCVPISQLP